MNNQAAQTIPELKSCPFCGGEAERIDFGPGDAENAGGSCIACKRCQSSGPVEFGYKENFISKWNRRAAALSQTAGVAHWSHDAAQALRPLVSSLDVTRGEYGRDHLLSMLDRMKAEPMSATKACRWLGWIQCALVVHRMVSLEDMKEHNAEFAAAPAASGGEHYSACCDTPAYCSSVRRCTAKDSPPSAASVSERARSLPSVAAFASAVWRDWMTNEQADKLGAELHAWLSAHFATALSSHRQAGGAFDWIIEITGNPAYPVRITEPAGVNAWEPHASSLGAKFILAAKKLLTAPPPGPDMSEFRELAKRWRDGLKDEDEITALAHGKFVDDLLALVEKGAGNG